MRKSRNPENKLPNEKENSETADMDIVRRGILDEASGIIPAEKEDYSGEAVPDEFN